MSREENIEQLFSDKDLTAMSSRRTLCDQQRAAHIATMSDMRRREALRLLRALHGKCNAEIAESWHDFIHFEDHVLYPSDETPYALPEGAEKIVIPPRVENILRDVADVMDGFYEDETDEIRYQNTVSSAKKIYEVIPKSFIPQDKRQLLRSITDDAQFYKQAKHK